MERWPPEGRRGFSLLEVVVAVVILAVGVLGLAGTTALVIRQIALSDLTTERAAALQSVIETLRATPFDRLVGGSDSVGVFSVRWSVEEARADWKTVRVLTTGPGLARTPRGFPVLSDEVVDSFTYRIVRP